jgi:hypothetical protein
VTKRLYNLAEVAEITSLSLGSVRQYVWQGIIPALYLGRKRMVSAEVLEKICMDGIKTLGGTRSNACQGLRK